jgi:hypothetical protein
MDNPEVASSAQQHNGSVLLYSDGHVRNAGDFHAWCVASAKHNIYRLLYIPTMPPATCG